MSPRASSDARCPHANCGCAPDPAHAPYCGRYCANAAEQETLPGEASPPGACACEHRACAEAQHPRRAGREPRISTGHS